MWKPWGHRQRLIILAWLGTTTAELKWWSSSQVSFHPASLQERFGQKSKKPQKNNISCEKKKKNSCFAKAKSRGQPKKKKA